MIFQNRDFYPLSSKEKILKKILRVLLIIIFSVVFKGMYNQNKGIDQDGFLIPVFCTAAEIFFLIYIFNAFTTGNLVRRWANDTTLSSISNFIKTNRKTSDEKTMELATKAFGFFGILVFITVVILEINFYYY